MNWLLALLPGLWVVTLAILLALALRRWFDPVPARCWIVWGIVLAVLFGAVLFAGRVMLPLGHLVKTPPFTGLVQGPPPGNPLQSDLILQIAPWLARVRAAYTAGEWPLWNPLAGAGEPLLANPQSQALQPLVLLVLPFPVAAGFGALAALRVLLALTFTYLVLRRQGISEMPALAGSLAFGLGGFLQLWLGWPLAGSAAFLPVLLYALLQVDQRGARRDGLLLALATASALLVGHPETELHVCVLAGAFALSRLLATPPGRRLPLAKAWAAPVLLGAALAAPVLLPAAAYLPQTLRSSQLEARRERVQTSTGMEEPPPETAGHYEGPVARLVPNAAPNAYGNNRFGIYWGDRTINANAAGFAGTAALLALLVSLWPLAPGRRFPQERLMLGTALVCLAILARPPGLTQAFSLLPVLRESVSFHNRISLLVDFAVVYGAACTWERWRRGETNGRRFALASAALAVFLIWAYLAHPGPDPEAFAWLRYGSLALQLAVLAATLLLLARSFRARAGWGLAFIVTAELLAFHAPANPPVSSDLYYPETPPIAFLRQRLDPWHRMTGLGSVLRPNAASVYGFADPRSSNPAKPAAYAEAIRRINVTPERPSDRLVSPTDPLYARLGVRFLLTPSGMLVGEPYRLVFRRPQAWIYRNRAALPFLFLPGMDPRASGLELGAIEPARMQARALLTESRLLASSVYQDGNWKLLINGIPSPTARTDGLFVAARLPAGESRIDLLYRPGSFAAGLAIAALALAMGAVLWVPPPPAPHPLAPSPARGQDEQRRQAAEQHRQPQDHLRDRQSRDHEQLVERRQRNAVVRRLIGDEDLGQRELDRRAQRVDLVAAEDLVRQVPQPQGRPHHEGSGGFQDSRDLQPLAELFQPRSQEIACYIIDIESEVPMRIRRRLVSLAVLLALVPACAPAPPLQSAAAKQSGSAAAMFRFAAYGDTRDNHDIHRDIVNGVLRYKPALVLQTGDLVHHGDAEEEWQIFDQITGEMRRQIPYYPARGNHDVGTKGFYEQRVTQPILSGNKLYYSFEKGNVHFVAIDTQQALEPESEQGRWLEADLAKAHAKGLFIVPFFHKAIFSTGPHAGEPDVIALKPILHPLFQKHGVRLVFEGHDHLYYRTVRDGITYVVTGGGGAPLYDEKHPELKIPGDVSESVNHFCIADVYPEHVTVTTYRRDGTQLDQFEVPVAEK